MASAESTVCQHAPPAGRAGTLTTFAGYVEARSNLFGTTDSLRWFVRKHQDELVKAGALLRLTNRWMIDPERFDDAAIRIGARLAEKVAA